MSPPPVEAHLPVDYAAMFRAATEAAEARGRSESHVDDLVAAMARIAPPPPPKASALIDWLRSSILPLTVFAIGAFVAYNKDQASMADRLAQMSKSLDNVSQRLDRDEHDTSERVKDLVPIIRGTDMAQKQSELIDRQQNDRIEATAQSILQLRNVVEKLSDAVNKTHEDLMIDRARRGEKESRAMPSRSFPGGPELSPN